VTLRVKQKEAFTAVVAILTDAKPVSERRRSDARADRTPGHNLVHMPKYSAAVTRAIGFQASDIDRKWYAATVPGERHRLPAR
jgi:hypothetical protein